MHPKELAERYFVAVRARDIDSFMALFAKDATFVKPDGSILTGATAIREMESHTFAMGAPTPSPAAMVIGANSIAVEINVQLGDGSVRRMADFFYLNSDGLIQNVSVYRQG